MRKTMKRKSSGPRTRRLSPDTLTIRHILVPLDFSGFARQALTCAVPLAIKHLAKISLVHVAQSPVALRSMPDGSLSLPVNTDALVSAAKTHLDELATKLLPDCLRGQTTVREGNAAAEVVAAARVLKADLIVLSNTGRSGLSRMLLGSTAERIVRHAHCPVLTVRRQPSGPTMRLLLSDQPLYPENPPWRRILVPIDFSLTSLRALQTAIPLARQNDARLVLLHVVEPSPYAAGMEGAVMVMSDKTLVETTKKRLNRIVQQIVPKALASSSLVARGRAADVIVEVAAEKGIDLIVLSTHGHTGLGRLFMGSTAEGVVRQAKCPVFVVRKSKT